MEIQKPAPYADEEWFPAIATKLLEGEGRGNIFVAWSQKWEPGNGEEIKGFPQTMPAEVRGAAMALPSKLQIGKWSLFLLTGSQGHAAAITGWKNTLGTSGLENEELVGAIKTLSRGARQFLEIGRLENQIKQLSCALVELARERKLDLLDKDENEHSEHLQTAIYRIAALSGLDDDIKQFCARVHLIIGELINCENIYIALLNKDGQTIDFPYSVDEKFPDKTTRPSRKLGRGATEYVLRTGSALLGTNAALEELVAAGELDANVAWGKGEAKSTIWLGVPLITKGGVIGVLAVQGYRPEIQYNLRDVRLLTFVASQFANSLHRREHDMDMIQANTSLEANVSARTAALQQEIVVRESIQRQLMHQVLHDSLTGLPNRRKLRERMEAAMQRTGPRTGYQGFAILYLDVDKFKIINDSLGHAIGDRVLMEVARRLSDCVRDQDMVSRISEDEFVVLMENTNHENDCMNIAERIIEAFTKPFVLDDKNEVMVSMSIGVSIYHKRHVLVDDVLREADAALYQAKKSGMGRWEMSGRAAEEANEPSGL
jgi:diguanylate cyclase (GGDEF)-like protein